MHLHRVTPDVFGDYNLPAGGKYLGQEQDSLRAGTLDFDGQAPIPVAVARFNRFGGGEHRKSDFEVLIEWDDIENMIFRLSEAGHPNARALQRARELAEAIKTIGWSEPEREISN
jgi:hypothetical protein